MNVSFDGVGQVCATFLGSNLKEGQAVKLSGSGSVAACGDGESFCGAALYCRDDACTVQVRGFMTLGYTGTAPSAGPAELCGNGEGGVKSAGKDDARTGCLVVDVDTAAKSVTIML